MIQIPPLHGSIDFDPLIQTLEGPTSTPLAAADVEFESCEFHYAVEMPLKSVAAQGNVTSIAILVTLFQRFPGEISDSNLSETEKTSARTPAPLGQCCIMVADVLNRSGARKIPGIFSLDTSPHLDGETCDERQGLCRGTLEMDIIFVSQDDRGNKIAEGCIHNFKCTHCDFVSSILAK